MSLADLSDVEVDFHFAVVTSDKMETFIYDKLKAVTGGNTNSIYYIRTKSDVEEMMELPYVLPFSAKKWLFIVEYDKVRRHYRKLLELCKMRSGSFKVIILFKKYIDYKKFTDIVGKGNKMYLANLNLTDSRYLLKEFKLNKKLFDFIYFSYRSDVTKFLTIREHLALGGVLTKQKDVTDLVGVSAGSLQHFTLQLLGNPPMSVKSLRMVTKRRSEVMLELVKVFKYRGIKTLLTRTVKDFLDIKTLYLNGEIYKGITNIPQGYDEKRLKAYSRMYNRIIEIPYERILQLYLFLEGSPLWSSDLDIFNFVYGWYNQISVLEESE